MRNGSVFLLLTKRGIHHAEINIRKCSTGSGNQKESAEYGKEKHKVQRDQDKNDRVKENQNEGKEHREDDQKAEDK